MEVKRKASKTLKARRKVNRHLTLAQYFSDDAESYLILSDSSGHLPLKVTNHCIDSGPPYDGDISGKPNFVPEKYWSQRYSLFSRYDDGVLMDEESWYSVTHEAVAQAIADTCGEQNYILDGFAGVGGNTIQFAAKSHVIAIEIDDKKANYLRRNTKVYGVNGKVKVIRGDFLEVAQNVGFMDVVFLSPPWGGPDYQDSQVFSMLSMLNPDLGQTLDICAKITRSVFLYMPRNIDPEELLALFAFLPQVPRKAEIQLFFFGNKLKTVGILLGEAVKVDPFLLSEAAVSQHIQSQTIDQLYATLGSEAVRVTSALARVVATQGSEAALRI